jgi:hypothetical protein
MEDEMTRVVNCRKEYYQVYIGRGSKWGNPYVIGPDGTREEVIQKYEADIIDKPIIIAMIKAELKGKILGCYCKPKACHGDILARIAEEE